MGESGLMKLFLINALLLGFLLIFVLANEKNFERSSFKPSIEIETEKVEVNLLTMAINFLWQSGQNSYTQVDYDPSLRLKEGDDNVMFRNMNHEVRTIPFRGVERTLGCSRSTDQIVAAPFNSTAPLYAGLMVVENQATKHQLPFSSGAPSTYSQDNID